MYRETRRNMRKKHTGGREGERKIPFKGIPFLLLKQSIQNRHFWTLCRSLFKVHVALHVPPKIAPINSASASYLLGYNLPGLFIDLIVSGQDLSLCRTSLPTLTQRVFSESEAGFPRDTSGGAVYDTQPRRVICSERELLHAWDGYMHTVSQKPKPFSFSIFIPSIHFPYQALNQWFMMTLNLILGNKWHKVRFAPNREPSLFKLKWSKKC